MHRAEAEGDRGGGAAEQGAAAREVTVVLEDVCRLTQ